MHLSRGIVENYVYFGALWQIASTSGTIVANCIYLGVHSGEFHLYFWGHCVSKTHLIFLWGKRRGQPVSI